MKTCRDCIGFEYDICKCYYTDEDFEEYADGDIRNVCRRFKDKSKFIELPCSIGDTVYMIVNGYDDWSTHDIKTVVEISFKLDMLCGFNKRFFLTREEAQKKLEDLNG